MRRRRSRHKFTVTTPQGEPNVRIDVLAYSQEGALILLLDQGYENIEPWSPQADWRIDKARVQRLAREMGIRWPITIRTSRAGLTNGTCRTIFGDKARHSITISLNCTDPERVLRHELGHALDNEQSYEAFDGDTRALLTFRKADKRARGYYGCAPEQAARAYEDYRLDFKLTRAA